MQLCQGFQCLPCVLRLARSYSSSFRIFVHGPRFVCPHPRHRVLSHQDSFTSLPSMCESLYFPSLLQCMPILVPNLLHIKPCVSPNSPPMSVKNPWHPPLLATPTPHFPCQERSNYTEISTEKDRLLLWHQCQGSCKSGATAAATSGHCARL